MNRSGIACLSGLGFLCLLAAVPLTGCGGDSSTPPTQESFCREKAKRECEKVSASCAAEMDSCVEDRFDACKRLATTQVSVARQFRDKNQGACFGKVSGILAKPQISAAEWKDLQDTCLRVWEGDGTMAGMTACVSQYDCLKEFICDKNRCAQKMVKGNDAFCNNPGEVCQEAQTCAKDTGGTNQCVAKASQGLACSPALPCLAQYHCTAAGICGDKLGLNSDCTSHDQCQTGLCDPFQSKCLANITFAANGPTCIGFLAGVDVPGTVVTPTVDAATTGNTDAATTGNADAGTD